MVEQYMNDQLDTRSAVRGRAEAGYFREEEEASDDDMVEAVSD